MPKSSSAKQQIAAYLADRCPAFEGSGHDAQTAAAAIIKIITDKLKQEDRADKTDKN